MQIRSGRITKLLMIYKMILKKSILRMNSEKDKNTNNEHRLLGKITMKLKSKEIHSLIIQKHISFS